MEKNGMTLSTDIEIKVAESQEHDYNLQNDMDELIDRVKDRLSDADKPNNAVG